MQNQKKAISIVIASLLATGVNSAQFDYDGDNIADIAVRRASTQYWYVRNSGDNNFNSDRQDGIQRVRFGLDDEDIPVAADFDGDGITDFAVRRPASATWYVKNSSGDNTNSANGDGIQRQVFGLSSSDIPVPADYDGDGMADFAVRRASNFTWYIKNSSGENFNSDREDGIQRIVFGLSADDVPVPGLYDQDNIADVAVWRASNSTWYIKNSSGSNFNSARLDGIQRIAIGQPGDIPVPADYDGDGITDIAVRRPENFTWYIRYSSNGSMTETTFGNQAEDIPVPADYDGDGKADIAVRRSSEQTFYILNSSDSRTQTIRFGLAEEDIPINAPITEIIAKLNAVNLEPENTAPVADAGADQTVPQGSNVQLDGANSSDADNDPLTYAWQFISKPQNSLAQLSDNSVVDPGFTADQSGLFILSLVVNDGQVNSSSDEVTITVEESIPDNTPPVANAGTNQQVSVNSPVSISGAQSSDADGDSLSYSWEMTSRPDSSNAELTGAASVSASFTPDIAGNYQLQLTVNDGTETSTDTVTITASNNNVDIKDAEFINRSGDCGDYVGTYFANVSDLQESANFTGSVTVTASSSSCRFAVNEIPNHDFNETGRFATRVSEQAGDYSIARNPSVSSENTALSLRTTNAVTLNGVVIDLLAAACYDVGNEPIGQEKIGCGDNNINNPWRYDPMSPLNTFGTDEHNAHSQPDGTYHYHGDPLAMYDLNCAVKGETSPVIGFAADGFPIYGPCFNDNGNVRKAQASYVLKSGKRQAVSGYTTPVAGVGVVASDSYDGQFTGDWKYQAGSGDLDECNGMTVNGQYGYYLVDQHPWVLKCYKGVPDGSFSKQGRALQNLLHRHGPDEAFHRH